MSDDDPAPRRPLPPGIAYVYAKLADDLQARIVAGEFPRGTHLPGRGVIAAEYSVGELTVRRAVQELEARGAVRRTGSRGALVLGPGHEKGT